MPDIAGAAPYPEFDKRSRAVLVADVVGYSRLMEGNEAETHARWRSLRIKVCGPLVVSHRGEIAKNTGDGFIALFESPNDAVNCASRLQDEITNHEASIAPRQRLAMRVGLHWEPVILDENDVFGSGVNIAVRLQGTAPTGGIVVSRALLKELNGRDDLKFEDLGHLHLKNLSRPIHAYALTLPGVNRVGRVSSKLSAKLPSIAVLPFTNLSSDTRHNYFADGIAEDIVVTLSNLSELLVVSRSSTMALRSRRSSPLKIGERLGVRYLLTGTVRHGNGDLKISVELLDVATGSILWAESYQGDTAKVFDVQDEIAGKIVSKIAIYIRQSEIKRALRKPPNSLNAYDHLLKALDLLYRLDQDSFTKSRALLEQACAEDNTYAAPYAFLAHWHMLNIAEGWSTTVELDTDEVLRLSQCAVDRDPCNGLALAIQGHGRAMFQRDYDQALALFERALAVSPNNSWAWVFSSGTFGFIGDAPEGINRAEHAIRLAPIGQQAFFNYCLLAQNHYLNGTFDEAIRWSRRSLSLNPRFGNSVRVLIGSLMAAERIDEAQEIAHYHERILPHFTVSAYAKRCPFSEHQASEYVERLRASGIPF
jgi:adenylate cyclase